MGRWVEKPPEFVASRYDRLAPVYRAFEWAYALPLLGIRRKTVEALRLRRGDAVLEVGCGSGRNFALLERAIGPGGALYGVDLSPGMLSRARTLCWRRGWLNAHLAECDAAAFVAPTPIRAALFCFAYSTMRDRRDILRAVWEQLEPGGRLVVTDIALREGWPRRWLDATSAWVSDRTLLGNPSTAPWRDLARLPGAPSVEIQRISFLYASQFAICAATRAERGGPET